MKRTKTRIVKRFGGFTGGDIVASKNFILRSFKVTGNLVLLSILILPQSLTSCLFFWFYLMSFRVK